MGTVTSTGTSAAEVSGTAYTITGGTRLIEMFGAAWKTTVATTEAVAGFFRMTSPEFDPPFPLKMPFTPMSGAISLVTATAANAAPVTKIARMKCNIGLKPSSTTITDYCNFDAAPAAAGYFISGVLFI